MSSNPTADMIADLSDRVHELTGRLTIAEHRIALLMSDNDKDAELHELTKDMTPTGAATFLGFVKGMRGAAQ